MSTKIIATIGPASNSLEILSQMINSGMTIARLNFSHGSHDYHLSTLKALRAASSTVGVMLDTRGPEVRTGALSAPSVQLSPGETITFHTNMSEPGTATRVPVNYAYFANHLKPGDMVYVDDGLIKLEVSKINLDTPDKEVSLRILSGGELKDHKGVNVPGVNLGIPVLDERDKKDLEFGASQGVDFVAVSFVQTAADVVHIREFLKKHCARFKTEVPLLVSKIECVLGVENFEEILAVSDGVMVARGDLGIEVPLEKVVRLQKRFVRRCREVGKPVVVATQMLQSMTQNPLPTRAEVADVYNAVLEGADCVMLSAESASGRHPVESVAFMRKVADEAEERCERKILVKDESKGNANRKTTVAAEVAGPSVEVRVWTEDESLKKKLGIVRNVKIVENIENSEVCLKM